jgi:glyoxylase-like metal-dependent hydrolase (beta-lactamase superfamily II)
LPAGNDQLVSLHWQPLPGAPGAQIYPLIRKIDTISSNSYLIQTPDAILLIDPGGLPEQAEQLMQVVTECRRERDRPFFVILTHAHCDHFFGIQDLPAFAVPDAAILMIQDTGAVALEQGDGGLTQADLFDITINPMHVGFHLFTPERREDTALPVEVCLANGGLLTVTAFPAVPGTLLPDREVIRFGPGPAIECWHTPGHSPDSICIRCGELLFIGDILFAANPGIAGLVGWSQEALIRSLTGIGALLSQGECTVVCPGHGRLIAHRDATRMLATVRTDALALADIAELNRDRAVQAAAFAEDCMEEVNELFTVMAGRLYYVSYVLDELEEPGIAAELDTLIHGDAIDELLEAFRTFAEEHHRGEHLSIHLALKAGQVIAKLQRTFNRDELSQIIDPDLVLRAERLLSDYTTMLRGFAPVKECLAGDLRALVEALVAGLSVSTCSDEDVLASADDEAAFARILLSRIGARPLLEDVEFALEGLTSPLLVAIDRDHFTDLLTYILEDMVGTGADTIRIALEEDGPSAVLRVSGNVSSPGEPENGRFLAGLCERAGGLLTWGRDGAGMRGYTIRVTRVV